MTVCRRSIFAAALGTILAFPAVAHEVADPTIKRTPRDGTVRLYGAGGPDTAFKKVAAVFTAETGIKIEVTGGPEPTWSRKAQADADVSWGAAEEDITALLETYTNFAWVDVTPIYIRPAIIPIRKGNPKHISGFEDLLKPGMRLVVTEGAGVANTSGTGVWEDVAALEFRVEFRGQNTELTDRLCTDRLSPWLASPASSFLSYRIKHFSDSPLIRCRHGARGARIHLEGFNIPMLTIQPSPNGRPDC